MKKGFTLIELVIVIAIIGILSVVVVLVLNPFTILQQSRDAKRLSDLKAINGAIDLFHGDGGLSLGSSSIIYISIPDPVATSSAGDQCQGLGLTAPSSNWTYHCSATSTYRNTDGTGWLPINFNSVPGINLLNVLPVDPTNTTSSFLYYSYATNGSQWQLYTHLEALSSQPLEAQTGGYDYASYKLGTNVNIDPSAGGMMAYWPMNEGSGGTIYDQSGDGYNGTINGATWITAGCNKSACLSFNGTSAYVQAPSGSLNGPTLTICAWEWFTTPNLGGGEIIGNGGSTAEYIEEGSFQFALSDYAVGVGTPSNSLTPNTWQYICGTRSANPPTDLYINGALSFSENVSLFAGANGNPTTIGADWDGGLIDSFFQGDLSNIRVYGRVLSSVEIQNLYNAGG